MPFQRCALLPLSEVHHVHLYKTVGRERIFALESTEYVTYQRSLHSVPVFNYSVSSYLRYHCILRSNRTRVRLLLIHFSRGPQHSIHLLLANKYASKNAQQLACSTMTWSRRLGAANESGSMFQHPIFSFTRRCILCNVLAFFVARAYCSTQTSIGIMHLFILLFKIIYGLLLLVRNAHRINWRHTTDARIACFWKLWRKTPFLRAMSCINFLLHHSQKSKQGKA